MSAETDQSPRMLPWENPKFQPTARDWEMFGRYVIENAQLIQKPLDVADDHLAYNPSGIWTVNRKNGKPVDIAYLRVEPNRSSSTESHLGKQICRAYILDPHKPHKVPVPFDEAMERRGEDAALTKFNRKLRNGTFEQTWLLSCVDAQPDPIKKNEVATLKTSFYAGTRLDKLEHIADGPEWMKDIRIVQGDGPLGTELEIFGRPQDRTMSDNGNISHATLDSIDGLSTESIASALIIDEDLFPKGSGIWGGVNDVIKVGLHAYVLVGHRAWRTGENGTGRHYESVLYGYHARTRRIVELGVLATAADFPGGVVKDDQETNLTDVVFSGGGYNGSLDYMSCGVGDGNVGLLKIQRKR